MSVVWLPRRCRFSLLGESPWSASRTGSGQEDAWGWGQVLQAQSRSSASNQAESNISLISKANSSVKAGLTEESDCLKDLKAIRLPGAHMALLCALLAKPFST